MGVMAGKVILDIVVSKVVLKEIQKYLKNKISDIQELDFNGQKAFLSSGTR
jgi:hypothetical protein